MKSLVSHLIDRLHLYPVFNSQTVDTATVFMMHNVHPDHVPLKEGELNVSMLREYLRYLKSHQYTVLPLTRFVEMLRSHEDVRKAVVITIDDGFRDFYLNAFPLFREFQFPATVFLTSDFIEGNLFFWWNQIEYVVSGTSARHVNLSQQGLGTLPLGTEGEKSAAVLAISLHCKSIPDAEKHRLIANLFLKLDVAVPRRPPEKWGPLSWDEISEMRRFGIDFYPHSKTHPILSRIGRGEKLREVEESKKVLEEHLGITMDIFCYPNGEHADFDEEVVESLKEAGYRAAMTAIPGFNDTKDENDLFRLKRFVLPTNPIHFKQYICGLERLKYRAMAMLRRPGASGAASP